MWDMLSTLCNFSTFFSISVVTHATACKEHVTRANEFYNMRHLSNKSTPVAKSNIPTTARQQRTAKKWATYVAAFVGSDKHH